MITCLKVLATILSIFMVFSASGYSETNLMNFDSIFQRMLSKQYVNKTWVKPLNNKSQEQVKDVKVTLISDVMTGGAIDGNWGFSAFVEIDVDGTESNKKYILFDTGYKKKTLTNIKALIVEGRELDENGNVVKPGKLPDFSKFGTIENPVKIDVVLSHWHDDHIEGFADIKNAYPNAFGKVHVGDKFFLARSKKDKNGNWQESGQNQESTIKKWYNTIDGANFESDFVVHKSFDQIFPEVAGIWLTGPVKRQSFETNYPVEKFRYKDPSIGKGGTYVWDEVPDDMAFIANTKKGLIVVSGCGHSGLVNILDWAYINTSVKDVFAILGGLHMRSSSREDMAKTSAALSKYKVQYLVGSHCTGTTRISALQNKITGLDSSHAYIGTAGLSMQVTRKAVIKVAEPWASNKAFPAHNH